MVVGTAYINKEVSGSDYIKNVLQISVFNILGVLFVVMVTMVLDVFMDGVSISELGYTLHEITLSKTSSSPFQVFVSGMMCNWFVGLAVWLCNSVKEGVSKILAIWFPIMIFVVLGFQHSIANTFLLISTYVSSGDLSLLEMIINFVFSFIGNLLGGFFFVATLYTWVSRD